MERVGVVKFTSSLKFLLGQGTFDVTWGKNQLITVHSGKNRDVNYQI